MARNVPLFLFLELLLLDLDECDTSLVLLVVLLEIMDLLDESLGLELLRLWDLLVLVDAQLEDVILDINGNSLGVCAVLLYFFVGTLCDVD